MSAQTELRVITRLSGQLDADGFLARCELADGSEVALVPRVLGAMALTVGPASGWTGWADEWMFAASLSAVSAYIFYTSGVDRDPPGWTRHVSWGQPTVRRRDCDVCGRMIEWSETADGQTPVPPACDHSGTET